MPDLKEALKEIERLPFEEALKRLEGIVGRMEDGNAPLEELIALFEQGGALASLCQKRLDELQKRIEILVKDSAKSPQWEAFEPESGDKAAPQRSEAVAEEAEETKARPAIQRKKAAKPRLEEPQGEAPSSDDVLF